MAIYAWVNNFQIGRRWDVHLRTKVSLFLDCWGWFEILFLVRFLPTLFGLRFFQIGRRWDVHLRTKVSVFLDCWGWFWDFVFGKILTYAVWFAICQRFRHKVVCVVFETQNTEVCFLFFNWVETKWKFRFVRFTFKKVLAPDLKNLCSDFVVGFT
jgi:hypothetical protein